MCGRYVVVSKIEKIEQRFNVSAPSLLDYNSNFNVSPGDQAPVITSKSPKELQLFRFGLRPFWAKKPMYLINARSEGDFNKENDTNYRGRLGLRDKPSFRKPFRSQRCLVLADAFIEGTTKERLNKPYLIYPIEKRNRPFAFAGLFDEWVDKETGEVINSFCIITTVSTPLLQMIPHHRSPVVLNGIEEESIWLNENSELAELEQILRPDENDRFNGYPISNRIKSPINKDRSLIDPIGERLRKEYSYEITHDIELFGMGMSPSRNRRKEE